MNTDPAVFHAGRPRRSLPVRWLARTIEPIAIAGGGHPLVPSLGDPSPHRPDIGQALRNACRRARGHRPAS